jgi:hypothetical protein
MATLALPTCSKMDLSTPVSGERLADFSVDQTIPFDCSSSLEVVGVNIDDAVS